MDSTRSSLIGLNGKFRSGIMFMLTVLLTLTSNNLTCAKDSDQLSEDMGTLREQKTNAEEMARLLKEAYAEKKISDESLREGKRIYLQAQAAYDQWITKLQADLTTGWESDSAKEKKIIQNASEKGEEFTAYVSKLLYKQDRGPAAIAVIVGAVVKAGLEIWREWRNADQQKREGLKKELDKLRWKPFREIT